MPKAPPALAVIDLFRLAFEGFLPTPTALEALLDRLETAE